MNLRNVIDAGLDIPAPVPAVRAHRALSGLHGFNSVLKEAIVGRELLSGNDWAKKYRIMGEDNINYRRWQSDLTPYLRDIADSFCSSRPEERVVVVGKAVQIGMTELSVNEVLRRVHQEPCTVLAFLDTFDKADRFIRSRWDPALKHKPFSDIPIARHGASRYFPGGAIHFNGANSPTGLSSSTASLVIGDEASAYKTDIGGEGDFLTLARGRISTAEESGKILIFSKFVDKATSAGSFFGYWMAGDCREYLCPCEGCGEYWLWDIEHLEKDDDGHYMRCECGHKTREGDERTRAVAMGKWESTKERDVPDLTSYRVSGFIGPSKWKPWEEAYVQWRLARKGEISDMRSFMNNWLGLPHDTAEGLRQSTPSEARKKLNSYEYKHGDVPEPVIVLTFACDVQATHLEWEVKGWGADMSCYSIDRGRIHHRIGQIGKCVEAIREIMNRRYDGLLRVWLGAIDTGGYSVTDHGFSTHVREICKYFPDGQAAKTGKSGALVPIKGHVSTPARNELIRYRPGDKTTKGRRRGSEVYGINVDVAKLELYSKLAGDYHPEGDPTGMIYAPTDYPEEYFEEIRSETMKIDKRPDRTKIIFLKASNAANEALDLHCYSRFCIELLGIPTASPARLSDISEKVAMARGKKPIYKSEKTMDNTDKPEETPTRKRRSTPRRRSR